MKKIKYSLIFVIYSLLAMNSYALENMDLCVDTHVVVRYTDTDDFHMACQSVSEVIALAKKIGLKEELDITISFVDELNMNNSGKALATFKPDTMNIQVLSIDKCKKLFINGVVLNQEIDLQLYKSIIIHELAHALLWANKGNKVLARELHEYFAYVIQFTLLSESYRNKIIASSDVQGFTNRAEISEDYYLMSPTRFAVKSYLHFLNNENGWTYLKTLLE